MFFPHAEMDFELGAELKFTPDMFLVKSHRPMSIIWVLPDMIACSGEFHGTLGTLNQM